MTTWLIIFVAAWTLPVACYGLYGAARLASFLLTWRVKQIIIGKRFP